MIRLRALWSQVDGEKIRHALGCLCVFWIMFIGLSFAGSLGPDYIQPWILWSGAVPWFIMLVLILWDVRYLCRFLHRSTRSTELLISKIRLVFSTRGKPHGRG